MDKEISQSYYRQMLRIRRLEETIHRLYLEAVMYGMPPHLSVGQEAVAAGVCVNLRRDDYIVSTHRGHGHTLAKGGDPGKILAEVLGKATGQCKGRGGSMHIADISTGNLGANGIVGGGLPIATGAGLSVRYRGTDQVCVCFFGDAAANIGSFHESVNMCAAFKLPVVFVCENNMYGLSTHMAYSSATANVSDRAKGYGIPGPCVDGMDVFQVAETTRAAIGRARQGQGPTLIECKTYRYFGHGAADNRSYRTREEEEEWKAKDPIGKLHHLLLADGVTPDELGEIEAEVTDEMRAALEWAMASPDPDPSTAADYVFSEEEGASV